ncbi:hypothetical protein HW560_16455 [Paenibacillus sp. E222]|uniref:deaminase domain-containing protein n=1 Tax=Paenibacillus sp. E222 TaxID=2748863 RepID=UPI0015C5C170|nr:deaminase domain-containing protein [Paenibacillus sp. E222]QLG39529.1 hypothetical protein HW560_16455 [Paenibacillus sp. E222]
MDVNYQGDGFELQWPYKIKDLRSFRIERAFNAHTRCVFTAHMSEEEAEQCLLQSSFNDSLVLQKPTDARPEGWFAGGITKVDIQMEDGIPLLEVEALSRTYIMDMKPRSRSYQNKHLTYTDAIRQLVRNYASGDAQNMATSDQASIGALLVQYEETDWKFLKRLASRVGTVILPDVSMDAPRVYFGVPDLSWGKELHVRRYKAMKDRAVYEELRANAEGKDAERLVEADFVNYRVTSDQYCQVGDDVSFKKQMWVVSESVISYSAGLLQYEYLLVKRQSLRRKSRRNDKLQGMSLEGRVIKRANNMVKVHLDIDDAHDQQGNWWFPYSGEGNNIFHCLPDEGARIKVYFPSGTEKKAMAINSVRGGGEEMKSRTVFQKPSTKVFEMPGEAKMQLGDDGVLFEKGTVSLHLDGGNITLNASEDLLVVAGNQIEAGSGGEEGVLESLRIRAEQEIVLQTNTDQYVILNGNRMGIQSAKVDFQKIEVDFVDLLTEEELEELYLDKLAQGEIAKQEIDLSLQLKAAVQLTNGQRADIRNQVAEKAKSDPGMKDQAKNWLSTMSSNEQKTIYQQKYINQSAAEPEKKSKAEKQAELASQQKVYDQMDQDRTAMYDWKQQAKQVMDQGQQAGKSSEEIRAMMPAPPVLSGQGSSQPAGSSGKPGMIQQFVEATGIGGVLEKISPWLEQMELAYGIPQKPDYLSKQTQKTVYLSRYTFEELIIGPQVLIAEFNIIFGVVAIIAAIPTGGGSLYMLAVADAALGVSMIVVNAEKLNDLKNGNANTNPTFLGMDQELLDKLGITLMVVNLAMLAKHGLNKAADKLVNSKNSSALGDTWAAWKQQIQQDPAAASGKTGPKTAKSKPSRGALGGPGKNRPFDEFDDLHLYDEASKGRTSTIHKVEPPPKTEGTGDGRDWFPTRQIDPDAEGHIIQRVSELKSRLSNGALNKSGSNFAYAEVDISGIKKEFYAHSQVDGPPPPHQTEMNYDGFSFKPQGEIRYPAEDAPNSIGKLIPRNGDTEHKIINDLANQLGEPNPNITGKIKLFTENDTCASCNKNIRDFKKDYPGIIIEIIHNDGNKIPKK